MAERLCLREIKHSCFFPEAVLHLKLHHPARDPDMIAQLDGMLERFRPLIKYAVLSGERSLIRSISVADIPVLERRLERHDSRRQEEILEDLYSFSIYRG